MCCILQQIVNNVSATYPHATKEASVSEGSIRREVWKLAALAENGVAWEAVFDLVGILNELKWMRSSYDPCLISAIKSPVAGL